MSQVRAALIVGLFPLALSLAACSSPSSSPTATTGATSSPTATASAVATAANLSGIKVTGEYGKTPTVTFAKPFTLGATQTRVIKQGNGRKIAASGIVKVNYYGVNGRDGKVFDESFSKGAPAEFAIDQVIPGFKNGLLGQEVGSRVLIGIPGKDGYDSRGGTPDGSIKAGDTILFVVDIIDTSYETATGTAVTPKAGLPTVTFADGKASIAIPDGDPPKTLQVQTLIKGAGAKVTKSSTILVKYTGVSWKTKKVIEENWTTGESTTLGALIPGWQQGLPGQTVGSRVLLVIPPGLAYPNGHNRPKVDPGDTLVYSIDILYAAG